MSLITKLYDAAHSSMEVPRPFGKFHLTFVIGFIVLTALVSRIFRDCSEKTVNRISGFVWMVVLVLEIYKQLLYGVTLNDGVLSWDYAWFVFPFQFCSSPLYILPIIAFVKNEKLRNAAISYMMTFSLFAGLVVFCYPNDVFNGFVGINYQTMIHHGSQILMGVFYAVRYRKKATPKFFAGGTCLFVVMVFIAMALNVAVHYLFDMWGINETCNLFFISPYYPCTLPLLSVVWSMVPYLAFVCVYFFGFILCALLVFGVERLAFKGAIKSHNARNIRRYNSERDCLFYYNM